MLPEFRVATHPGQILLAEFLEPLQLTQTEFARALSVPLNRVNELVRGKRGITPESALLFSEYFRNSPEFWMNLQTAHDLSSAREAMRRDKDKYKDKEIRKRHVGIRRIKMKIKPTAKARRRAQGAD